MCTRAGSLASIHSEQENWFIWERLTALAAEPAEQMYWLGMRKPAEIVPDEDGEMQKNHRANYSYMCILPWLFNVADVH